ncbi:hypothetical protein Nepgr_032774 [Nepenthes gracilis]|uniref:Uncharacterized protein n=1 Tax=Nepenthes gracilis TaxID=150966 RepID=A0AAD3Y8J6_NEPGR|nr:hypothetical protein Nepgr_032774 [Nepenthes gracilis]
MSLTQNTFSRRCQSRTCNSSSQSTPKRAIYGSGGDLPPTFAVSSLLQMWHRSEVKHQPDPRKPTPERKRSPLKGKNSSDQWNAVDATLGRLVDRIDGLVSGRLSSLLTRSVDLAE